MSRDITFSSLRCLRYLRGSSPSISAASLHGRCSCGKARRKPIPEQPPIRLRQNASLPIPTGETTPTPVMTTRGKFEHPAVIANRPCDSHSDDRHLRRTPFLQESSPGQLVPEKNRCQKTVPIASAGRSTLCGVAHKLFK